MPGQHWARNFVITNDDLEYLTGLLLERETPLSSDDLARALIENRVQQEIDELEARYKGVLPYTPDGSFPVGTKLIFPAMDFEVATVISTRPGNGNIQYGDFNVIAVAFENDKLNKQPSREFASDLKTPHALSRHDDEGEEASFLPTDIPSAEEILTTHRAEILQELDTKLKASPELVRLTGKWFPRALLVETHIGHINLAEAVLDLADGVPLSTEEILDQIGGLENASQELQVFSLNYALNNDSRFDEVGPSGEILWSLTRLEPKDVVHVPPMLSYAEIDYDPALLDLSLRALELEICDELSDIPDIPMDDPMDEVGVTLIYPHRRMGTFPLNARTRPVFPTARSTPRVWVTMVDNEDGEEFPCWIVRNARFVYGLAPYYRKHRLPIGAYVNIFREDDDPGKVAISYDGHRPRTEWIRLITSQNNQIAFENHRRAIGAEYDDLMVLGADDLAMVDGFFQTAQQQKKPLSSILKTIIPALGRLTPQGTAHAKTIYSAVNIVRRCPPGPIFATLIANPDFQTVGDHYWKLTSD
ncbi:MAG: hypothetical protein H6672_11505 [Anaerolineaceae bacterium]|nr:hypothetical protein [Anaerolineaceae bacterium]